MKNMLYLCLLAVIFSCEKEIQPELNPPAEVMVIDAWINQKMERQEIHITRSHSYFDSSALRKISGATVKLGDVNTGEVFDFQEGASSYYWDPTEVPLGVVGHQYKLTVSAEGDTFVAFSKVGRVPPVDSIKFHFQQEDFRVKQAYYTAEFVASDPVGVGDTYWIKAWKNGTFLGKPEELNLAYDAGFIPGHSFDGNSFLVAIRKDLINPFDQQQEKEGAGGVVPPYVVGDSLYIEIHSLDPLAFDFLHGMSLQINRPGGFAEFFASPLANTATNFRKLKEDSNTTDTPVAGFFNMAAVSSKGQKLSQEIADRAKLRQEE